MALTSQFNEQCHPKPSATDWRILRDRCWNKEFLVIFCEQFPRDGCVLAGQVRIKHVDDYEEIVSPFSLRVPTDQEVEAFLSRIRSNIDL